jgi:hypothetical protein
MSASRPLAWRRSGRTAIIRRTSQQGGPTPVHPAFSEWCKISIACAKWLRRLKQGLWPVNEIITKCWASPATRARTRSSAPTANWPKSITPTAIPGDEEAAQKFKEITEAYEVLCDPEKRARYDRYGFAGLDESFSPPGTYGPSHEPLDPFFDLLSDFFGFGGRRSRRGPRPGRDLETLVEIDLREAFTGTSRTLDIERLELCGECGGAGIPRGYRPETCSRCGGHGEIYLRQGLLTVRTQCRSCQGLGYRITQVCPRCQGRGKVQAPPHHRSADSARRRNRPSFAFARRG